MIAFRFKVKPGPAHHRVQVFVGKDFDHLALSGELTMRHDEYAAFAQLNGMAYGADRPVPVPSQWEVTVGPILEEIK